MRGTKPLLIGLGVVVGVGVIYQVGLSERARKDLREGANSVRDVWRMLVDRFGLDGKEDQRAVKANQRTTAEQWSRLGY